MAMCVIDFPKGSVAFGDFTYKDYTKINERLKQLEKISQTAYTVMKKAATNAPKLTPIMPVVGRVLASPVPVAGVIVTVISILVEIVDDADELHKKLKELEEKMYDEILEGELKALKANLEVIGDEKTSDAQRLSHIDIAITNLHRVLPFFNGDSILREKYHLSAPLFVQFCVILKWVAIIAEGMPEYNSLSLRSLKTEYQEVLMGYFKQCIGRRLASCYLKSETLGLKTLDWTWHSLRKSKYYDERREIKRADYKTDLDVPGWLCDCNNDKYYIVDEWDRRSKHAMVFEEFKIQGPSDSVEFRRNLLREYRKRVELAMMDYFNHASLGDTYLEVKDDWGDTELHDAVGSGDKDWVLQLLENRANVNAANLWKHTPLHTISKLKTYEWSNYCNTDGVKSQNSPNLEIIKTLILNGSDVYAKDRDNMTFLHHLLSSRYTSIKPAEFHDITEFLFERGHAKLFDISGKWFNEVTPLMLAVGKLEVQEATLSLLRSSNVNFKTVSKKGTSLREYAIRGKRSEAFLANLTKYGA